MAGTAQGPRPSAAAGGTGPADPGLPKGFRSAELGWPELDRIPHPRRRLPLLGDVLGVDRRRPVQDSMRLGRELGPVFRRRIFGKEFVMVWGAGPTADLADESRFAKHVGLGVANLRPLGGDGLFTAYNHEPNWQLAHDVLVPGFSREAMAGYHGMMLAVAGRLTDHWDRELTAGRPHPAPRGRRVRGPRGPAAASRPPSAALGRPRRRGRSGPVGPVRVGSGQLR